MPTYTPEGHERLELPHDWDHLVCPHCGARQSAATPIALHGHHHAPDNPLAAAAQLDALAARDPADVRFECHACQHVAPPADFGLRAPEEA